MFPTALSGRCKQNSEDYRRARRNAPRLVRHAGAARGSLRQADSYRLDWRLTSRNQHHEEFVVLLIAYYVAFMIAGDLAAYVIGLVTEVEFGGQVSLVVFLALYFVFLWIAWVVAVWLTKPKTDRPESARSA
jgi:hypothetical protein